MGFRKSISSAQVQHAEAAHEQGTSTSATLNVNCTSSCQDRQTMCEVEGIIEIGERARGGERRCRKEGSTDRYSETQECVHVRVRACK